MFNPTKPIKSTEKIYESINLVYNKINKMFTFFVSFALRLHASFYILCGGQPKHVGVSLNIINNVYKKTDKTTHEQPRRTKKNMVALERPAMKFLGGGGERGS